jgi:exodeoxyribonuclease VII large subunit
LRDAGEGDLQRQFEALKTRLRSEGLFDDALKKSLPRYPARIAVITSPSGAAVRDMLHVLRRRWPLARVRLYPVSVQGENAAREIIDALEAANRHGWAQLVLLGRGGGSLEDLAAFNDEGVARSVAASALPVVSAVGHETDFSICDFVADLRAPTPSAAAEQASPDGVALARQFAQSRHQLHSRMERLLQQRAQRLDHLAHRLNQQHPARRTELAGERLLALQNRLRQAFRVARQSRQARLEQLGAQLQAEHPGRRLDWLRGRVEAASGRLPSLGYRAIQFRRERLRELGRTLNAISPLQVFERGYAAISDPRSGRIITRAATLTAGDPVRAQLADGSLECTVDRVVVTAHRADD